MKVSAAQGAENAPKSLQIPKSRCSNESIRRRNKRAVHKKENQKYAPFSYRKNTLRVSSRNRHGTAANPQPNKL
jgi:hypothetical protein